MLKNLKARYSKIKNSKKGFTLIELVVVIAIMAILALIMVPNLTAYIQKGDDAQVKANMKNLHTAAELTIQSDPTLAVSGIASFADTVKTEIGKFANVDSTKIAFAAAGGAGTAVGTYYMEPGTGGKVKITYSTDKKIYTFDGVAYTDAAN